MTKERLLFRWQLPLLLALGVFLLKAIFIFATPVRSIVMTPWLIDDSFIVMRVARNIAFGYGFSFDGSHLTTGVSPLWTYITSVIHMIMGKDAAVKATLLLSSLFGSIATILTFNIAYRITKNRALAWISFLLVTFLPVTFFNAMNGMETAFFALLMLLAVRSAFGIDQDGKASPFKIGLQTGIYAGLAFLTRIDAIFLIAAIFLIQAFTFLREKKHREALLHEWGGMATTLGTCVVLYILWQLLQTGSLFPDNQIGRRTIAMMKHGYNPALSSFAQYLKISAWHFFELESLYSLALGSSVLALLAVLIAIPGRPTAPIAILVGLYAILFSGTLVLYQWYFPDFHGLRYLNPLLHLLPIFIADLLLMIPLSRLRPVLITVLLICFFAVSWYRYLDFTRAPLWAKEFDLFARVHQEERKDFWESIDWIRKFTHQDAVFAIRDHGRYAYFTDRPIQDLAGILDPQIIREWKAGQIASYLQQRNVSYAFLPESQEGSQTIYQAVHDSMRLSPVADAPKQNMTGFRLYKVEQR